MFKKILVLDDDEDLLEIMDIILADNGYDTLTLLSGNHIFENIALFCPDLILMDVLLGDMDGRLICRSIKANKIFTMPVILISATHNLEQVMHQQGAPDDFISKPFDIYDLLARIEKQLN